MGDIKDIKVIVLGSGTGVPSTHRGSPAYLVRCNSFFFLLDIGPGTLRQLARLGIDHSLLNAVLVTHFHPDHTSDIVHLLFATRYPPCLKKRSPFVMIGPPGFSLFLTRLKSAYSHWLDLPENILKIIEIQPGTNYPLSEDLTISTSFTQHSHESMAYSIETSCGRKLVYSGDTGPCEEIVSFAQDANLLILESSFPENSPVQGHLTPVQAGFIASKARAQKLLLSHFYPECLGTDIPAQCREQYGGELIIASDLLEITV